jgi:hypothetical protein
LIICKRYSWDIELNFGFEVSVDMEWKGIQEKAGGDNSTNAYIIRDEASR